MPRFWTHPGANYAVNVDQVAYAWAEDEEQTQGGKPMTHTYLTFVLTNGQTTRNKYQHREQRDTALRLFQEFANTTSASMPVDPTTHEVSMVRREVGGQTILVLTGCTCGWRVPDEVDVPEDAVAYHLAAARTRT